MSRWLILIGFLAGAATGCHSTEKVPDQPMVEEETQAPEPRDFQDDSLFEVSDQDNNSEASPENYDPELGDSDATLDAPDESDKANSAKADFPAPSDKVSASPPKTLPPKESATTDKSAMRRLKSDCNMRAKASIKSQKIKMLTKGKKLWTEPHSDSWFKVYRSKTKVAYLSKACF